MTIFMFSMAGIPPLAGFLGKLYVFQSAIQAELYGLAIIGVLASVYSAFYYLRIVKVMYFDQPVDGLDGPIGFEMKSIIGVMDSMKFLLFIDFLPGPLLSGC